MKNVARYREQEGMDNAVYFMIYPVWSLGPCLISPVLLNHASHMGFINSFHNVLLFKCNKKSDL